MPLHTQTYFVYCIEYEPPPLSCTSRRPTAITLAQSPHSICQLRKLLHSARPRRLFLWQWFSFWGATAIIGSFHVPLHMHRSAVSHNWAHCWKSRRGPLGAPIPSAGSTLPRREVGRLWSPGAGVGVGAGGMMGTGHRHRWRIQLGGWGPRLGVVGNGQTRAGCFRSAGVA